MPTVTFGENTTNDNNSTCEDCLIYEATPNTNQEAAGYLGMGKGAGADRTNRAVIKFNIKSALTASGATTIDSAKIYLYPDGKTGNHTISAYRIFRDWNESQVTWNSWKTGSTWSGAGCSSADDSGVDDGIYDRKATAEDSDSTITIGSYSLILDITDLANKWLSGEAKEYGVLLQSNNESQNNYATSDDSEGVDGVKPYLEITYSVFSGYFSGTVYELENTISGAQIYAYRRDTGEYIGSTTSSGDGSFYVETSYSGSHFLVCLDPVGGQSYNDLIYGEMYPITISG